MVLPVLISVPHGGTKTPPEIKSRTVITAEDLFDDGDAFTREIYDLRGEVAHIQRAEIARAFIDLNRAPGDLPPGNPDGVVKTATCYDRPIYRRGEELDVGVIPGLLERYYWPYHRALEEATTQPGVAFALDCHSMAERPPAVSPDRVHERPLFCLSNDSGRTAPMSLMRRLASAIANAFGCSEEDIGMNRPFKGGYITRRHGGSELPWIQVEMNRSLYLSPPWFNVDTRVCEQERLVTLRRRFLKAVEAIVAG